MFTTIFALNQYPTNRGIIERDMDGIKWGLQFGILLAGFCLQAMKKPTITPVGLPKSVAERQIAPDSTKKYIYLTFDDGPQHGTVDCYHLCRNLGIKASFFMVGQHQAQKTDGKAIVTMIRNSYPQSLLVNHSYTHANNRYIYFYRHPEMAARDFFRAQDSLRILPKIARLPGNRAWVRMHEVKASNLVRPVSLLLDSAGYNLIGWDIEWSYTKRGERPVQSPGKLLAMIDSAFARKETHSPRHLVILTHDRMFQRPGDLDSLSRFIQLVKQHPEYVFETVDHYPGLKKTTKP